MNTYHRLLLLTVFLVSVPGIYGQVTDPAPALAAQADPTHTSGLTFTIAPLSIVGSHRRMRAGLIWQRPRWNYLVDLEYAPGFRGWGDLTGQSSHHFFYGIRPEIRYALAGSGTSTSGYQHFVGVEVPVNYLEVLLEDGRFHNTAGEYIIFDRGLHQRERLSVLLKYTLTVSISRHFHLEWYGGAGIARRKDSYSELVNARTGTEFQENWEWGWGPSPAAGTRYLADLALGFRIGYRL
ncbi:MAG: hypothetical protein WA952_10680 [Lewinella sp.]